MRRTQGVASAGDDGTMRPWDAATGKELYRVKGGDVGGLASVAFAPDGKIFMATTRFN
jgi:WD40 repeat protein